MKIDLTEEDLQNLGALIDAAIKASGLQGAKIAVPLVAKIEAAINTPVDQTSTED